VVERDLKQKEEDDGTEQLPELKKGRTWEVQRWALKFGEGRVRAEGIDPEVVEQWMISLIKNSIHQSIL